MKTVSFMCIETEYRTMHQYMQPQAKLTKYLVYHEIKPSITAKYRLTLMFGFHRIPLYLHMILVYLHMFPVYLHMIPVYLHTIPVYLHIFPVYLHMFLFYLHMIIVYLPIIPVYLHIILVYLHMIPGYACFTIPHYADIIITISAIIFV